MMAVADNVASVLMVGYARPERAVGPIVHQGTAVMTTVAEAAENVAKMSFAGLEPAVLLSAMERIAGLTVVAIFAVPAARQKNAMRKICVYVPQIVSASSVVMMGVEVPVVNAQPASAPVAIAAAFPNVLRKRVEMMAVVASVASV